ncbi:Tn3 family transposase [Streptomyces sp. NPDC056672]|uniref:Tn3 family transposase n=1 Tax=Streptomyces sp. NPDC056672 TaxID=3345906 RepID=UPI0036AD2658
MLPRPPRARPATPATVRRSDPSPSPTHNSPIPEVSARQLLSIAEIVRQLLEEGWEIDPEDLAHISPYLTEHINRFGEYGTHELGIQPEAYDPKLDVDFTPLREQDLTPPASTPESCFEGQPPTPWPGQVIRQRCRGDGVCDGSRGSSPYFRGIPAPFCQRQNTSRTGLDDHYSPVA